MAGLDPIVAIRAREAVEALSREGKVVAAYVFGSHACGRADEWSDIDLAAFLEGAEDWDIDRRAEASIRIQRRFGDDIELHLFPASVVSSDSAASFSSYIRRTGVPVDLP